MVTAPDAPTAVEARWAGPGKVRVSWAAPTADGGLPITGYSVYGVVINASRRQAIVTVPLSAPTGAVQVAADDVGTGAVSALVSWSRPRLPGATVGIGNITAVDTGVSDATTVLANVTMVDGTQPGYVSGDMCSSITEGPQTKSTANHAAVNAVANLAAMPVDEIGSFCLYSQVPTHLVVDVQGQFSTNAPLRLTMTSPERLVDTRANGFVPGPASVIRINTSVPAGTESVLVNLTMTDAAAAGYVTADRCSTLGNGPQTRSSGNHLVGRAAANLAVVPVDTDGSFCVYTQAPTHLAVDLQGWFSTAGKLKFTRVGPERRLDTRVSGPFPAGGQIVRVGTGVPADATGVLVNVTMTAGTADGYVTADRCSDLYAGPQTRSTGNHGVGQAVANLTAVPVGVDGTLCIYTQRAVHLVVDIQGWFGPNGDAGFSTTTRRRALDTRVS